MISFYGASTALCSFAWHLAPAHHLFIELEHPRTEFGKQEGLCKLWFHKVVLFSLEREVPTHLSSSIISQFIRIPLLLLYSTDFSKCIFTSKTSHLYDELQIIHVPFFCLNELVNVALPFPFHGLHGVKALEISTPCRKQVRSLISTQGIKSDKLTKLHQHSAVYGSDYTGTAKPPLQQQWVSKPSYAAINPLPSLCHF